MFYDVPVAHDVSNPTTDIYTGERVGGRMKVAIFDCPFDAMSFARWSRSYGLTPQINRRVWSNEAISKARISDYRKDKSGPLIS